MPNPLQEVNSTDDVHPPGICKPLPRHRLQVIRQRLTRHHEKLIPRLPKIVIGKLMMTEVLPGQGTSVSFAAANRQLVTPRSWFRSSLALDDCQPAWEDDLKLLEQRLPTNQSMQQTGGRLGVLGPADQRYQRQARWQLLNLVFGGSGIWGTAAALRVRGRSDP